MGEPEKEKKSKTSTTLEGMVAALPAKIFRRGALTIITTVVSTGVASVGLAAYAQTKALQTIDERFDKKLNEKLAPIVAKQKETDDLKRELEELGRRLTRNEDRDSQRFDVLYGVLLTGKPDKRAASLAEPTEDAGK